MHLKFKAKDTEALVKQYLVLLNQPILNLSDSELTFLSKVYMLRQEALGTPEHILQDWVLSTPNRQRLREELEVTANNLNVLIHRMKNKTVLNTPILEFRFIPPNLNESFKIVFECQIQEPQEEEKPLPPVREPQSQE